MAIDDGIQSARLASHLRKKHEKKTKYATMRRRSVAYSIDSLLVGLISTGIGRIFSIVMPNPAQKSEWMAKAAELQFDDTGNIIIPSEAQLMSNTMSIGMDTLVASMQYNWPLFLLNTVLIPLLYFSYFIASAHKATPGMRWCKIVVTDRYGGELTFLHAVGRTLCTFLTTLTLGVGFFTMRWHPRKRALHDVLAKTDVRNVLPASIGRQPVRKNVKKMIGPEEMAALRAELRAEAADKGTRAALHKTATRPPGPSQQSGQLPASAGTPRSKISPQDPRTKGDA